MKIGRNAPCPCGSGKKYKKCCMKRENQPVDLLWRRLGDIHDKTVDDLMHFAENHIGKILLPLAMDDFLFWPEVENPDEYLDLIKDHEQIFWPWFLFNWVCDPIDTEEFDLKIAPEKTIADIFIQKRGKQLDPLQRRFIETTSQQPFSFYEVVSCQPGQGCRLKDIFTGEEIDVMEKMGSQNTRPNDILLCRIVQIDHVAMMVGNSSFIIAPQYKLSIIELRRQIKQENPEIDRRVLKEYDEEIREQYMEIYQALHQMPELHNTDGEPLQPRVLHYKINDPDIAFDKLCSLTVMESPGDLRRSAKLDEKGHILEIEIPWDRKGNKIHKGWTNTILGRMEIKGNKLTVEVNSEARENKIKKEIKKRMGKDAVYKTTEIRSLEALMAQDDRNDIQTDADHEELMQIPEVRQQVENMLTAHWEGWIDQKIPALGGKTPRQAVKSADGKESVEALLAGALRFNPNGTIDMEMMNRAIQRVRHRLGLDKKSSVKTQKVDREKENRSVAVIKDLIRNFGRDHLNDEYTGFALKLCDRIVDTDSLQIHRGRTEIWAAAIVHVICRLNFLFDPDEDLSLKTDTICDYFSTVKSTVSSKASSISDKCDLFYDNSDFCRQEIVDMFSIIETPEGFITTKALMQDPPVSRISGKSQKEKTKTNVKQKDDRQQSLFDDF